MIFDLGTFHASPFTPLALIPLYSYVQALAFEHSRTRFTFVSSLNEGFRSKVAPSRGGSEGCCFAGAWFEMVLEHFETGIIMIAPYHTSDSP